MASSVPVTDHLPEFGTYIARVSALDLARRSLVGAPVYAVISLILLAGTPILTKYGWWAVLEGGLLLTLAVIRILFALGFEERYDRIGEKAVLQFSILTALQSLALGVLTAIVLWYYWNSQQSVLTIVLSAGCIAAGTSALAIRKSARAIFLVCVLAPLGIAIYIVGGLAMALLILGFLVLMAFLVQDGGEARRTYLDKFREHYRDLANRHRIALEDHAKKYFLAGITHEIRTMVYSIIGVTSLLQEEKMAESGRFYLHSLQETSRELWNLVNNIPGGVKSPRQNWQQQATLASLSLRAVIHRLGELYRVEADAKGLAFSVHLGNLPERILIACQDHLEQILAGLLANALKFTERGAVKLKGDCRKLSGGVLQIRVSVIDSGAGIPAEMAQCLFNPFPGEGSKGQADAPESGFGLPMCRQLAEEMDGDLQLESIEGQGTTVSFTFEAQPDPTLDLWQAREARCRPRQQDSLASLSQEHPHHILVVDDDELHRHILCAFLAKHGYQPAEAADGQQAIDALRKKDFDLVFMDLRMPGMDGLETTRWIREHFDKRSKRLHIIALTADASLESRTDCLGAGVDNFLAKPVLASQLESVLTKPRLAEQAVH